MLALIQRVTAASVTVDDAVVGAIGPGLLALVAVEPGDDEAIIRRMAQRLLGYRVFADAEGRMNRSLADTGGGLLLVSQFTLAADCSGGNRPSFGQAASPQEGQRLYDYLVAQARSSHPKVATGEFAAHMQVHLVNDGPVTIPLRIPPGTRPVAEQR